jgi:hypothetical protein
MGIRAWLKGLLKREDVAAMERAKARDIETSQERAASSGDIEGMTADAEAARLAGEASTRDTNRLGDG